MDRARSTHEAKCVQISGGKARRKEIPKDDADIGEKIILK
jgi:hypothetical protein